MLVNKCQDNKLEKLLHLVGDLFELYNGVRTYKTFNFCKHTFVCSIENTIICS